MTYSKEIQKEENKKPEDKIEKMSKEKILNIKENKVGTHDENTKIKKVLSYADGQNIVNLEEKKRRDNKDIIINNVNFNNLFQKMCEEDDL